MGNRSKKSAISDINQFTGVGKLFRKISHPRDLGYESFNARPVFCVCKAPPGWSGVKKSRNRGGSECSAIVGIPCDRRTRSAYRKRELDSRTSVMCDSELKLSLTVTPKIFMLVILSTTVML